MVIQKCKFIKESGSDNGAILRVGMMQVLTDEGLDTSDGIFEINIVDPEVSEYEDV